jgi:hypothetical protein
MDTERVRVANLPDSVTDSVCDHIWQFTVGLTRIIRGKSKEYPELIGTGTRIIVDGLHCILTADHVLTELKNACPLGLLTSKVQRYIFDRNHLEIHSIARGSDHSKGPDIGLIVLPQTNIGHLKAQNSFFNIDKRRGRFAAGFLDSSFGFWATSGVVAETETDLNPERGFKGIKGYLGLFGRSGISKKYKHSGFDYLEMTVDYDTGGSNLPHSFGGCSGGGIWQIPLRKTNEGVIEAEEHILSGIVFYQTAIQESHRFLRGHGRETVYVKVPESLEQIRQKKPYQSS